MTWYICSLRSDALRTSLNRSRLLASLVLQRRVTMSSEMGAMVLYCKVERGQGHSGVRTGAYLNLQEFSSVLAWTAVNGRRYRVYRSTHCLGNMLSMFLEFGLLCEVLNAFAANLRQL